MLNTERNPRIDFLRGIAISCVLVLHFALAYGLQNSPIGTLFNAKFVYAISYNGNYGVTMFFVVSGFLITRNSLRRWGELRHISPASFYLQRFARIMPTLLLVLAVVVLLGSLNIPFFANTKSADHAPVLTFTIAILSILTFWHNVLMQSWGYFNYCLNVYWSLSVEEMFYLAMPILCLLLRRTWLIVAVCLLAIVAGPIYRSHHTDNEIYFMYDYLACFDAIAFGCLTALLAQKVKIVGWRARLIRIGAGIALAAVYLNGIDDNEVFGFSMIAITSAIFLLASANDSTSGWTTGRLSSAIRWMGWHSYEIYLFHVVVLGLMRNFATKATLSYALRLPWFCLFLILTSLVAMLVSRFVAEPANAAIRRRYSVRLLSPGPTLPRGIGA